MKEDIKNLRELQTIDIQVLKIDEEVAAGVAELEKRGKAIEERKASLAKIVERIEAAELRRKELETQLEEGIARIKDRQTKLMNVQTNREYQSLLKEIDDSKKANKEREDEIVRLMESVEAFKASEEEQQNFCTGEEKLLYDEAARITKVNDELKNEKEKIMKSRETMAKKVNNSNLRKYDQLREKRNGVAVVAVSNGVCHGCYMNIPPQLYNELLRQEKLLACPTCNRMIFYLAEAE